MKEPLAAGAIARLTTFVFLLFLIGLLPYKIQDQTVARTAFAQDQASPTQPPQTPASVPESPKDQGIPLPQIANRAEELDNLLQTITGQLEVKAELLQLKQSADDQEGEIRQRKRESEELLAGAPTPIELADEQRYWHSRNIELAEKRKLLTALAGQLANQLQILDGHWQEWQATWTQMHNQAAIGSVVRRVQDELDAIRIAQQGVQEQLNLALNIQNKVSEQAQLIADALLRVHDVGERERSRLLEADALPLWKGFKSYQHEQPTGSWFNRSFARSFTISENYLQAHGLGLFLFAVTYFTALFGVYRLRRYAHEWKVPEVPPEAIQLFGRPFSVALQLVLLGTAGYIATAPVSIAFIYYLLYLFPVLRLLKPMIAPALRGPLNLLVAFFIVEGIHQLSQLSLGINRAVCVLIILGALLSFGWITRQQWMGRQLVRPWSRMIPMVLIQVYLVLLVACLVTNIFGFVSLSELLGMACLASPFVAIALYCGARVLTLIWNTVLCAPWTADLSILQAVALRRWGSRLLTFGAALLWLRAVLHLLTIHETALNTLSNLFRLSIGFEKFSFTLGGVLAVILILFVGYCLANVLRFFLRKFVLGRLHLQRGLPYAIYTVTYYICLLLVGLAALSASGVELTKFTVLTGALGVGLGFGLQNIVNNFVSGLILIFERPIHVGDTVEVGGFTGTIRRIGARSSTVLTYQGAEVIVPNSNFLSNHVINWTLSSPWRRVDVPVKVAYGTNPEQVIKLLEEVAKSHPGVLLERPPEVFFLGFGESALNFELRFWCASQELWFQLQSNMTIAVVGALQQAGIEVPIPQRELHIHSIQASKKESVIEEIEPASATATPTKGERK
jgi:potassium-dependent mechanosensitive channel